MDGRHHEFVTDRARCLLQLCCQKALYNIHIYNIYNIYIYIYITHTHVHINTHSHTYTLPPTHTHTIYIYIKV